MTNARKATTASVTSTRATAVAIPYVGTILGLGLASAFTLADGVQNGHTKGDEQLPTDVGCEDAPNLIKEPAEGVAKARRN